jgi:esterase/lipase
MKMIYFVGAVITLIVIAALSGPQVDMKISLNEIVLPSNLDVYLSESESQFEDIIEGTEKKIIWAGVPGEKTDISIVFVHGFSATRQELAPLADIIASSLEANLFYTRLAGHGRGGSGMIDSSVNRWANDANEALKIGRRLGNKVVLIGTSTGSTLITWLSLQPSNKDVQAIILLSPNFHPANSNMSIVLWPWGEKIAEMLIGKTRHWESNNPLHEKYWANDYSTAAMLPMMGLVKIVNDADLNEISTPTLMVYSSKDKTISVPALKKAFHRFGSIQKEIIEFNETEDPDFHALAGDLLSPSSTKALADRVTAFVKRIPM